MEDATAAAQSTNLISFQSALQNGLIDWNEVVEELGRPFAAFDVGWPTQQSKGNLRRNQHKSIKEIDWICLLIEGWAERNCWLGCLIEWVGYGRLAANGSAQEEQTTTPTNQRKGMNFASPTAISLSEWSEEKRCGGGRKKQSEWSTKAVTGRGKPHQLPLLFIQSATAWLKRRKELNGWTALPINNSMKHFQLNWLIGLRGKRRNEI